jgi:hypothetical protein
LITARSIIQSITNLFFESIEISQGPKNILYSLNPSSLSQSLIDLKDEIRDPVLEFNNDPLLRFIYDPKQNELKVWCAYRATHERFEGSGSGYYILGTVNVKQKRYVTESDHPDYYPDLDHTFPKLSSFLRGLHRTENLFDLY